MCVHARLTAGAVDRPLEFGRVEAVRTVAGRPFRSSLADDVAERRVAGQEAAAAGAVLDRLALDAAVLERSPADRAGQAARPADDVNAVLAGPGREVKAQAVVTA